MDWTSVVAKQGDGFQLVKLDLDDHQWLAGRKLSIGSHGYAQVVQGGLTELLHRCLLGLSTGEGGIGDHINGDRLDNRRANLRIVDPSGSSQNVTGRGKSRFRGVHPVASGRWMAVVKFQGTIHRLGTYESEIQAARVADAKRRELMPHYVLREEDRAALYGATDPTSWAPAKPFRYGRPSAEVSELHAEMTARGMSNAAIAAALGMSTGGLSASLWRARQRVVAERSPTA